MEDERNIFCQGLWHFRSLELWDFRCTAPHRPPLSVSPPQQIKSSPLEGQSRFQTCSSSCCAEVVLLLLTSMVGGQLLSVKWYPASWDGWKLGLLSGDSYCIYWIKVLGFLDEQYDMNDMMAWIAQWMVLLSDLCPLIWIPWEKCLIYWFDLICILSICMCKGITTYSSIFYIIILFKIFMKRCLKELDHFRAYQDSHRSLPKPKVKLPRSWIYLHHLYLKRTSPICPNSDSDITHAGLYVSKWPE